MPDDQAIGPAPDVKQFYNPISNLKPALIPQLSSYMVQDARGAIKQVLACVGQSQPARRAIEQPRAELLFQPGDRLGDCGL